MHKKWFPIAVLCTISLVLKLLWIGHNELAHDEPFTVLQAHRSLAGLFKILPEENNPPLHFILMQLWVKLVPPDAAWLRVPSAIFSALIIWPLFSIGRKLHGERVAWIASLLFIFSSYHAGFAHEVRAYSLFALLATTSILQLHRISIGKPATWLVVVNILMVYTHFFGWLMIGIQFLCVFLMKEWRPQWKRFLLSLLPVVIAFLPYILIFTQRVSTSVGKGTWLTSPSPEEIYNMIWDWSNAPVAAVFFIFMIAIHLLRDRLRGTLTRLAVTWAFVPLIGMWIASQFVPIFLDRYLIYASPGFYLLCAVALTQFLQRERTWWLFPITGVLLMLVSFKPYNTNWPKPSKVIETTAELRDRENVPVYIHPWWYAHTFAWHTDPALYKDPENLIEELSDRNIQPLAQLETLEGSDQNKVIVIVAGAEEQRMFDQWIDRKIWSVESTEADRHVHVHLLHHSDRSE